MNKTIVLALLLSISSGVAQAGSLVKCLASVDCQMRENTPTGAEGQALCQPANDVGIDVNIGEIWLGDEDDIVSARETSNPNELRVDVQVEGDIVTRQLVLKVEPSSCDIKELMSLNF